MKTDPWAESAKTFYRHEAAAKSDPTRFSTFVRAYQKLTNRFPDLAHKIILDAGCGTGFLTKAMGGVSNRVVGIDISLDSLSVARNENPGGLFLQADLLALPFSTGCFDFGVLMTSLEFCANKKDVLAEVLRVLKPGQACYIEVRNADFFLYRMPGILKGLAQKQNILKAYRAPDFKDLSYREWTRLIEACGFQIIKVYPSLRPWNYGSALTRVKNLLIECIKWLLPVRHHYMTGFHCKRI